MKDNKKNKSRFYDNLTTKELEVVAKQGDVEAQFKLGYRYRYGEKAKKNFAKAIEWYTKAAEQGHAHSLVIIISSLHPHWALWMQFSVYFVFFSLNDLLP